MSSETTASTERTADSVAERLHVAGLHAARRMPSFPSGT